ncbi:Hypothetical protein D9617_17g047660 [Elsinoe fawcettii]|nr:Hypothetical protein D9617_17g047660 [Elsinoe fawcettii]
MAADTIPEELIVVCCHAIFNSDSGLHPREESAWRLKPFQKSNPDTGKAGEHETFLKHILAAVQQLQRPDTFVVFSGGPTDPGTQSSESMSYAAAWEYLRKKSANSLPELDLHSPSRQRWAVEEDSTDSFQNLLFSVIKFRQVTFRYPKHITIVTHEFKRARFLDLHAAAIRWPKDSISVLGIDPPWASDDERVGTLALEAKNAIEPFKADPYGVSDPLAAKRQQRQWDPIRLQTIADGLEPEVQALLHWSSRKSFTDALPWSK